MDIKKYLDKYFFVLIALAIIYTILISNITSTFKQLPSPIFGGDYYYQLGQIYYMYNAPVQEWVTTSNGIGQNPAYFIIYGALTTIFGKLFSLDPMQAMIKFNYVLPALSLIILFFTFKKVFNDSKYALIGASIFLTIFNFPILKYTEFTKFIVVPIFIYAAFSIFKEQNKKTMIIYALAYALMALTHSTAFVIASGFSVLLIANFVYDDYKKGSFALTKEYALTKKFLICAIVIGLIIAQIYWFKPIFIYKLNNSTFKSQIWSFLPNQIYIGLSDIIDLVFNTSNVFYFVRSILFAIGFYYILKEGLKDRTKDEFFFLMFFGFIFFLALASYITMPLLEMHFASGYLFDLYIYPLSFFIAIFGLDYVIKRFSTNKNNTAIIYLAIILSLAYFTYSYYPTWTARQSFSDAKNPIYAGYIDLQKYLLSNTNYNDVILSNNELSYMINALSGRKLVISRRAQNDVFTQDFDQRQVDAAIIFYGNNYQKKLDLVKKYNIGYLYIDQLWARQEFINDPKNGDIIGYSDPLLVFYSKSNEQQLVQNGIKYVRLNGFVDPAVRDVGVKTYDLLLVSPQNYATDGKGVWKNDIDKLLTPVWGYNENGQLFGVLYKVNVNN
ncbi:MAG: hypothetical protein AABX38_03130 [Candidatus Micrarchaeota archaeon]